MLYFSRIMMLTNMITQQLYMFGNMIHLNLNSNTVLTLIYFSALIDMLLTYCTVFTLAIHFQLKKHNKFFHLPHFIDPSLFTWNIMSCIFTSYSFLLKHILPSLCSLFLIYMLLAFTQVESLPYCIMVIIYSSIFLSAI